VTSRLAGILDSPPRASCASRLVRGEGPHGGARERDVGQEARPPAPWERARRESGERGPGEAERTGDRARGGAGLERTVVVLAKRLDCRSRRTTSGPHLLLRRRAVGTKVGLAPQRESAREANRRRKPDRGGEAARPVAGPSILHTSRIGESSGQPGGPSRGIRRRKAFWVEEASGFDEHGVGAILGTVRDAAGHQPERARGATGNVRGSSSTSHVVDNAAVR